MRKKEKEEWFKSFFELFIGIALPEEIIEQKKIITNFVGTKGQQGTAIYRKVKKLAAE